MDKEKRCAIIQESIDTFPARLTSGCMYNPHSKLTCAAGHVVETTIKNAQPGDIVFPEDYPKDGNRVGLCFNDVSYAIAFLVLDDFVPAYVAVDARHTTNLWSYNDSHYQHPADVKAFLKSVKEKICDES